MAREGITRAQVFNAADAISQAGQNPTVASVRAKLGTGSYTTITALLRDWKEQSIADDRDQTLDVPEEVTAALGRAAEIVWRAANDHFSRELAAVRKEAERTSAESAAATEDALAEIARLEEQIQSHQEHGQQLAEAITRKDDELQDQFRKAADLETERAELRAQLKAAEARIAEQAELLRRLVPEPKKAPAPKAKPTPRAKKNADKVPAVDDKTMPLAGV